MRIVNRFGSFRSSTAIVSAVCILGIVLILFIPLTPQLSIIHNGVTVLCLDIPNGESFILRYTHSVNRSAVYDTIERADGKLIIRSSLFQAFGAGIPIADDIVNGKSIGTSLTKTERGLLLDGIDTVYPQINLMTGTYSDHRIITDDKEFILKDIVGEKQLIKIKITRVSLFYLINREMKNIRQI